MSVVPGYEESLGRVLVSIQDITERVQVEEELRKHRDHLEELVQERTAELVVAKEAAEAASRAKSAFLANMSHELRTPLNAILGYAQILQRRPLDPDVINSLSVVQRSGEHLLTLINDILDIAKIEAGKLELSPTSIHLPVFLQDIASIIAERAVAKGLTFSFEAPDGLPPGVQADETRLRQVLLNLLDNAVKFTEQGEVVLHVGVGEDGSEASPHPHTPTLPPKKTFLLRFSVRDTGIGIPPDRMEHIFQPFEQAGDLAHRTKGTGLGLAISRQLVRLMGGDIHVQSEPGRGSTFWFEIALPVVAMVVEAAPPPERVIAGYTGSRRRVLVVDDVLSNRAVLVDLLQPLGFDVVEAADGQQALHLARALRPDLILMDRRMPVLDGFEAARQLRRMPGLKDMVVIAVSASVSAEDQARSREAGIDAFLPKPVHWSKLAALLEEHLGLEWIYEEQEALGEGRPSAPLAPPPQEEIAILYDLARMGDMWAIRERAAHIETLGEQYAPFARKLRALAEGFEEREILALVEQYMKADQ
jgi:signal transduction histidine kinase/DNA-binding NarL/FixJ family response regulator